MAEIALELSGNMDLQQYLLCKLAEEASEIAQIALKTQQFGLLEKHPDLQYNNQERCHQELNDLLAIITMLNDRCEFNFQSDFKAQREKIERVWQYAEYSEDLGMIST